MNDEIDLYFIESELVDVVLTEEELFIITVLDAQSIGEEG